MEDNPNLNTNMQDFDEAEERLSFCDLPMYSDAADWENFCKEDQSSNSSSEQEYFEFFSEEWNTSTTTTATTCPPQSIIFCGKLIPYKQPVSSDKSHELENNTQQKPKNRGLFRWNSGSFNKSKASKSKPDPTKQRDDKCDFSVQKVSLMASPSKSRWYLFMFGLARFPPEMALNDMKRRRSRQGGSTLFRSEGGGDTGSVGRRSSGKGWGLVRLLGCNGGDHHTNAVVKASLRGKL